MKVFTYVEETAPFISLIKKYIASFGPAVKHMIGDVYSAESYCYTFDDELVIRKSLSC
jgi:hypothetical protein